MKGWAWMVAALSAATVLLTWPQAVSLGSLPRHQDVLFSIWRLEWIAHAASHRGVRLFDANIFYPATGTLAYSDATLFEGVLAAPLIWAGAVSRPSSTTSFCCSGCSRRPWRWPRSSRT